MLAHACIHAPTLEYHRLYPVETIQLPEFIATWGECNLLSIASSLGVFRSYTVRSGGASGCGTSRIHVWLTVVRALITHHFLPQISNYA